MRWNAWAELVTDSFGPSIQLSLCDVLCTIIPFLIFLAVIMTMNTGVFRSTSQIFPVLRFSSPTRSDVCIALCRTYVLVCEFQSAKFSSHQAKQDNAFTNKVTLSDIHVSVVRQQNKRFWLCVSTRSGWSEARVEVDL